NKYAPAAIVLMVLGIAVIGFRDEFPEVIDIGFTLPSITSFGLSDIWRGLVLAGFAQIALTASNAIIATSATIEQYFPSRPVSEKKLALNTGIMNTTVPFMGGMPMCHGVGGLAGQYYFGARTGGTNIMEGLLEIGLGLFLAGSIADLFTVFPESILGAMLILVGIQLTKFAGDIKIREIPMLVLTAGLSLVTNMAIGFVSAIVVYQALSRWGRENKYISWIVGNGDK
ncbi:putative sulfate/molybdate transporter, partial [Chloroflexota bacterium]